MGRTLLTGCAPKENFVNKSRPFDTNGAHRCWIHSTHRCSLWFSKCDVHIHECPGRQGTDIPSLTTFVYTYAALPSQWTVNCLHGLLQPITNATFLILTRWLVLHLTQTVSFCVILQAMHKQKMLLNGCSYLAEWLFRGNHVMHAFMQLLHNIDGRGDSNMVFCYRCLWFHVVRQWYIASLERGLRPQLLAVGVHNTKYWNSFDTIRMLYVGTYMGTSTMQCVVWLRPVAAVACRWRTQHQVLKSVCCVHSSSTQSCCVLIHVHFAPTVNVHVASTVPAHVVAAPEYEVAVPDWRLC